METKDEVQMLSFIKDLQGEFVVEYEELKKKCMSSQEAVDGIGRQLNELSSKRDQNYDYFSPISKQTGIEVEKLCNELKLEKLNVDNYNNQCVMLLNKIKHLEIINEYISSMSSINKEDSGFEMEKNRINDSIGHHILQTQENERIRIAADLHDSTVQNLTNMVHKTELCLKLLDIDRVRIRLELQSMIDTIRTTIDDMRAIIYDLRPMSIDDLGLVVTIERYVKKLVKENEMIQFEFISENQECVLKPVIRITLFRIIQEACNNIIEHAQANEVMIKLIYLENEIRLSIIDNGIGFDNSEEQRGDEEGISFGLSIMKERTYLLSGDITIESEKNVGTKIFVSVPM